MNRHPKNPAHEAGPTRRALLRAVSRAAGAAAFGGLGLVGCGGGGDAAPEAAAAAADPEDRKRGLGGIDSGGTGSPSYFSVVLDAAQPLMAAGVVFDTAASLITDADGAGLALDALASGMACRIEASPLRQLDGQSTASASSVRVSDALLGPVASIDLPTRSFTVLGQRVALTSTTRFGSGLAQGLSSLVVGELVQVWGDNGGQPGQLVATRLDRATSAGHRVVRGVLSSLDRSRGEAVIGALHFSLPADGLGVVGADVEAGQVVRARWLAAADGGLGALQSMRNDSVVLPAGREVELHGRVTRLGGPGRIAVDGVDVDLSQASAVEGRRWLAVGARAEVHGRSDATGRLLADALTIEAPEPLEFAGSISRVDPAARSLVVQGRTVVWTDATVFEGGPLRLLTLRRRVAVSGRWNADRSAVIATRIHLEA